MRGKTMRGLVFVSSETLSRKSFSQNRSSVSRHPFLLEKWKNLSLFCAFFLLADFLVHRSLKKRVFWVRKNAKGHIFRQNVPKGGHIFALFATFYFFILRKLLLLHNLSRINTHDKFTLEDAVITKMIGSKLRFFFKSRDARYRSLARVVWACFCYKFLRFNNPHFVYVSTHYRALKRILFTLLSQTF